MKRCFGALVFAVLAGLPARADAPLATVRGCLRGAIWTAEAGDGTVERRTIAGGATDVLCAVKTRLFETTHPDRRAVIRRWAEEMPGSRYATTKWREPGSSGRWARLIRIGLWPFETKWLTVRTGRYPSRRRLSALRRARAEDRRNRCPRGAETEAGDPVQQAVSATVRKPVIPLDARDPHCRGGSAGATVWRRGGKVGPGGAGLAFFRVRMPPGLEATPATAWRPLPGCRSCAPTRPVGQEFSS